ncbi:MAG: UDP-N-acetylmuramoyl-tripeptide--D-alanyl-D-alanine ligase [Spirochaetes bacterium]|nr:UDP-N-acetylmuramoyl-tripeptide--D-alanyl-D-alanine ligase [Spirochaetota bacterium]
MGIETTVGWAAEACRGRLAVGDPSVAIDTVTTDSRELGERNLFVPIVGGKFDGHDYIRDLADNGRLRGYLTMRDGDAGIAERYGIAEIRCDDTLSALGAMAARRREEVDPEVIALTGTNGKTTTKELLFALLNARKRCIRNVKNYNNEIGLPCTLLALKPEHEVAVVEMGMNHPGEIGRLSRIARPDLALITNVGEGHLEFLGSVENVARAKAEIVSGMEPGSVIFLNREMRCFDLVEKLAREAGLAVETYGLSRDALIRPDSYRMEDGCVAVTFGGTEVAAPLFGMHNVYNLVAAAAVAMRYGMTPGEMRDALSGFVNPGGRGRVIRGSFTVIDDSYNANPLSVTSALGSIRELFPERRKIAVLADMKELGESSPSHHEACGRVAAENGFAMLLAWGEMAGHYAEGAAEGGMESGGIRCFETKEDLARFLAGSLRPGDVVLVKGSRSMKMEEVVAAVTERGE